MDCFQFHKIYFPQIIYACFENIQDIITNLKGTMGHNSAKRNEMRTIENINSFPQ